MRATVLTVLLSCACVSGAAGQTRGTANAKEAAAPAGAKPAPSPSGQSGPSAPTETLEDIVARVRRRLAKEATPRSAAKPAAASRIKLVWRADVVWPEELVGASSSEPVTPERVVLSWESSLP